MKSVRLQEFQNMSHINLANLTQGVVDIVLFRLTFPLGIYSEVP